MASMSPHEENIKLVSLQHTYDYFAEKHWQKLNIQTRESILPL